MSPCSICTAAVLTITTTLACTDITHARVDPPPPSPIDGMGAYEVRRTTGDAYELTISEHLPLETSAFIVPCPNGHNSAVVADQARLYTLRAGAPVSHVDLPPLPESAYVQGIPGVVVRPDGLAVIRSLATRRQYYPYTTQFDLIDIATGRRLVGPVDPNVDVTPTTLLIRGHDTSLLVAHREDRDSATKDTQQTWVALDSALKEVGRWDAPKGWRFFLGLIDVDADGWNDIIIASQLKRWSAEPFEVTAHDARTGKVLARTTLPKGIMACSMGSGAVVSDTPATRLLTHVTDASNKWLVMSVDRTDDGGIKATVEQDRKESNNNVVITPWTLPGGERVTVNVEAAIPLAIPGKPSPQSLPQVRVNVKSADQPTKRTDFTIQLGRDSDGNRAQVTAIPGDPGAFVIAAGRDLIVIRLKPAK